MLKSENILQVRTNSFYRKYLTQKYGEKPYATLGNLLGQNIVEIEIKISDTIKGINKNVIEAFIPKEFNLELVTYVDAQNEMGRKKIDAIRAYLKKYDISEDELPEDVAFKIYTKQKKRLQKKA
jgi:replication initiation and membrane attachment protein DnaB